MSETKINLDELLALAREADTPLRRPNSGYTYVAADGAHSSRANQLADTLFPPGQGVDVLLQLVEAAKLKDAAVSDYAKGLAERNTLSATVSDLERRVRDLEAGTVDVQAERDILKRDVARFTAELARCAEQRDEARQDNEHSVQSFENEQAVCLYNRGPDGDAGEHVEDHFPCAMFPIHGKPLASAPIRVVDLRREVLGDGYALHFGNFVVICTPDGNALAMPGYMRNAILSMEPRHDRVLCLWNGNRDVKALERLTAFSLTFYPKNLVNVPEPKIAISFDARIVKSAQVDPSKASST